MTDIKEDAPVNAAGSGAIAGIGVGPQGEPPGPQSILTRMLKRKKLEESDAELLPGYVVKHKLGVNNEHHYTIHKDGKEVGEARLSHTGKYVVDLSVDKNHRRKGLATALYKHIENHLGYNLTPSPTHQTPDGKAFWASRKSPINESTFAGNQVFVVPSDYYHKCRVGKSRYHPYEKYVGKDEIGETIRKYGRDRKNRKKPIIVQDERTGAMTYLRYGGKHRKE